MYQKVKIEIMSVLDGEVSLHQAEGEYDYQDDTHLVVYPDYTGNVLTKNGLYIGRDKLLLHRVGGVNADMLFDPAQTTAVNYETYGLTTVFALQTQRYSVETGERADSDQSGLYAGR